MLVQPRMKISAPHSLLDPLVLGRLLPSGQWGINRAAVFTFPDLGLLVVIPVWASKAVGDTVKLLLNDREVDGRPIIDEAELKQPTLLWVAPRHLQTGPYELTYEIKQPNQKEERPDKPLNLYVKLELPGGQDIDPGPGHSNLYMYIPPEIVNGGVDKDVAEAGVPIVIRSESGSGLPYPDIAKDDVIHLSWGGFFEYSTPVTQAQIDDPAANPILITVSKATIERAGDTDLSGLAVTFKVRDIVGNESEDWCKETRIVVTTGIDLLAAPIVQEAVNNKLDVDKQGDNDITVHVTADRPDFEMGDIIHLSMLGTTLEGEKVEVTALPQTVDNIPHNYEFKLPIADVRKLVNTQVSFFYRLERSGSSDPLRSKRQFVQVTGAAHRLAAPIIEEAEGEFIDPTETQINVRIPFDPAIEYGMGIELFLLGKSPDGSTFLPELKWHIPEEDEVENPEGFVITVDDYNLKLLDGGTLKGWYDLLIAEGDEILRRESLHTKLLNVGEPKFELDAPIVLGVQNGFLDPATLPGGTSKLTIPRPVVKPWVANDEATWKWVGDISGEEPGSRTFNAVTAQQDWVINLDAAFVAQHIEPNRGSKISVRYQLWRHATDETSLSNPLVFTVGVALELLAPSIKENNGDSTLNPLLVRDTLTIVVPDNTALLPTDEIIATWTGADGTPAGGSHTSAPRAVSEGLEFAIPNSVVAFNLGKQVKISYVVIIDGHPTPSRVFDLTVQAMPQSALTSPTIEQADNDGAGPELHTGNLTQASVRMGDWPLIALNQYVWLRLHGTYADGNAYTREIWSAPTAGTNPDWIADRFFTVSLPADELKALQDGSDLELVFKAALGQSTVESEAVEFPVRTYMIKAIEDVRPEITGAEDSKGNEILPGGTTGDTLITLEGTAALGQEVEIFDGATSTGKKPKADDKGIWTVELTELTPTKHVFKAKALYGSGTESEVWTVIIENESILAFVNPPYLTNSSGEVQAIVLNLSTAQGAPVPNGKITLTLPADFTYADGGTGARDFSTDSMGTLTVSGVKHQGALGSYNLTAISSTQTATAKLVASGLIGTISLERGPTGIDFTPDGRHAFVTSATGNTVKVIDTMSLSVINSIPAPEGPRWIVITPDGLRAFVANVNKQLVSVFDTLSHSQIKSISVGQNPEGITITPDGKHVYVVNAGSNTVSVINTENYLVIKTISVTNSPKEAATTPDGKYVLVSSFANGNSLSIIDTKTLSVKRSISTGYPWGIAISPDSLRAFVASSPDKTIYVIDLLTLSVINSTRVDGNPQHIAISPDGRLLFVTNPEQRSIEVINALTVSKINSFLVGRFPRQIAITPDGTRAFVCHDRNDAENLSILAVG
ncbi:beta-propeller fold lactonase family protein [Pseudomonas koreensis]|uniref:YVTN family beta-propeller repeat protein n=2 Tax=Pseudomonas TaxID=286 RepID=UPI0012397854|nr:beta-propeller fold lactonase family protein [Pseudomonas koreensis]KAA8744423.1 beta-propeller fold lactonase family protein [Pseudomonas koreensis]